MIPPAGWPPSGDLAPLVFTAEHSVRPAALRERLVALAARHEVLRTGPEGGQDPERAVEHAFTVVPTVSGDAVDLAAAMAPAGHRQQGAPPWSSWYVRAQDGPDVVLVGLDRTTVDAWSLHVLAEELTVLYGHDGAGPTTWPGPPAAGASALAAHRAATPADVAATERAHWAAVCADPDFGTDPRVGRCRTLPALVETVPVDPGRLAAFAAALRVTVLAVLATARSGPPGSTTPSTGQPSAGRSGLDCQPPVRMTA